MQEVHHTVNILPVNVELLLFLENWFRLFMGLIFELTKRKEVCFGAHPLQTRDLSPKGYGGPDFVFFVLPAETHIQAQCKTRMGIQGLGVSIRTTPRGWVPRAKLITVISSHCMHRFHRHWRSDRAVPRRR
jgi:hypothetical protein